MRVEKTEINRTAVNRENQQRLKCPYCPPNQGDNAFGKRRPHADKYKSRRKSRV